MFWKMFCFTLGGRRASFTCQWGEDERQEDETFILVVFLVVDVDENGEQGKEKENHTQSHEGLCALHPTWNKAKGKSS